METWLKISLLLCAYGILKECRPSEPFITEIFTNPPLNFSKETVTYEIYPVGVYCNMVELVAVFLVTDYLRYQPVIVICAFSGLLVYLILVFGRSLLWMQTTQLFYGLFMAGDIAYYSYIYAKVDKEHFQEVTSHTRTAYLIGRTISGITSQLFVSFNWLTFHQLNYLTIGGLSLAVVWSMFLPKVENSLYFHRKKKTNDTLVEASSVSAVVNHHHNNNNNGVESSKLSEVLWIMANDIKFMFSNSHTIFLLLWSVIATSCYYQVLSFVQLLWHQIANSTDDEQKLWNGAVETTYTLLGAVGTFSASKLRLNWDSFGSLVCSVSMLSMAAMLFVMSQTSQLSIAYVTVISFNVIYQITITCINSEIAKSLKEDSYGLIFGFAMFLSLVMQTFLTLVIVNGFNLSFRSQFMSYCAYLLLFGLIFLLKQSYTLSRWCLFR